MTSSLKSAKDSRKEGIKESLTNMGGLISEDEASAIAEKFVKNDPQSDAKTAEEAEAIVAAEEND